MEKESKAKPSENNQNSLFEASNIDESFNEKVSSWKSLINGSESSKKFEETFLNKPVLESVVQEKDLERQKKMTLFEDVSKEIDNKLDKTPCKSVDPDVDGKACSFQTNSVNSCCNENIAILGNKSIKEDNGKEKKHKTDHELLKEYEKNKSASLHDSITDLPPMKQPKPFWEAKSFIGSELALEDTLASIQSKQESSLKSKDCENHKFSLFYEQDKSSVKRPMETEENVFPAKKTKVEIDDTTKESFKEGVDVEASENIFMSDRKIKMNLEPEINLVKISEKGDDFNYESLIQENVVPILSKEELSDIYSDNVNSNNCVVNSTNKEYKNFSGPTYASSTNQTAVYPVCSSSNNPDEAIEEESERVNEKLGILNMNTHLSHFDLKETNYFIKSKSCYPSIVNTVITTTDCNKYMNGTIPFDPSIEVIENLESKINQQNKLIANFRSALISKEATIKDLNLRIQLLSGDLGELDCNLIQEYSKSGLKLLNELKELTKRNTPCIDENFNGKLQQLEIQNLKNIIGELHLKIREEKRQH